MWRRFIVWTGVSGPGELAILRRIHGWTSRSQPGFCQVPLSPSEPKLVMPQPYQA